MNKEFKVGDKVTSQLDGKGFVVGVNSHLASGLQIQSNLRTL